MVLGPVIQVMVPAVRAPASLSIWGPRAATMTGTGCWSGMSRVRLAESVSPSAATGPAVDQRHEDVEVLAEVTDRLVEAHAEHVLDDELVRQADAQGEASAGGLLGGEGLGGEHRGVAGVGGHDRRPELDRGGLAADDGQQGEGVVAEDLRRPVAGEALCLGRLRRLRRRRRCSPC